jgi:hypothetical protein
MKAIEIVQRAGEAIAPTTPKRCGRLIPTLRFALITVAHLLFYSCITEDISIALCIAWSGTEMTKVEISQSVMRKRW